MQVLMADFFMADQLTSQVNSENLMLQISLSLAMQVLIRLTGSVFQIPLLRHMEFAACYFMAGTFRNHAYETCTSSPQYTHLAYVISFLPYYWRAMQV